MALSIAWHVKTPAWDLPEAINRMADLRRIALGLPFANVDELRTGADGVGFCAHYLRGSESVLLLITPSADGHWVGDGQTKTLYAGRPQHGGEENFLCAHLSIIVLLDAAARLGCALTVHDGGGFWEGRDLRRLVDARRRDDRLVSAQAERIAGVIDAQMGHAVDLPEPAAEQELDRWQQNQAVAALLDLVGRLRR